MCSRMPEILRLIARLNVGGPARHVLRIEAPLRARGYSTLLVTGRTGPTEGELLEEARASGVEVLVLPELGRAIRPWSDLRLLAQLRALLAARTPAVLHTHTAKAGLLGRLAASRGPQGPALVHTFHGHVLSGYFSPLVSAAFRRAERALARRSDALIAVSEHVRDELLHEHQVGRAAQYAVIPPGFDAQRTRADRDAGAELRASLGLRGEHLLLGCVGRLEPVKGVDLLLQAFAALSRREPRARLLVVGDGSAAPGLREAIQQQPGASWLPSRRDLGAVYGALDILVLPSRREGLPQVLAEALAAGLPVVASRVGGVPDLVEHGRQGLLVPAGDVPALTAALTQLCENTALRAACARAAAATDLSRHSAEAVAERLAQLYAAVCQQRASQTDSRVASPAPGAQTPPPCISSS
ncbi:MAG: glycosyltransferase family 4 protein [Planctomycetota bacterium]